MEGVSSVGSWHSISWVGDQVTDYNGKYGTIKQYRIALIDEAGDELRGTKQDGSESKTFQLGQKPETAAPQAGDRIFGHVENGWKFVKEQTDEPHPGPKNPPHQAPDEQTQLPPTGGQEDAPTSGATGGSATSPAAAAPNFKPPRTFAPSQDPDDRQWSIVRQHSQEMAIRWVEARTRAGATGGVPSLSQLRDKIDWFQADAFGRFDTPELPDASSHNITRERAIDLLARAEAKMADKYLGMALDNLLGRRNPNPLDAFLSMTQEQGDQFERDYLVEEAA